MATASYIIIIIGNYVSVQANHTMWLIWLIIVDIRRTSSMRVMNKAEIFSIWARVQFFILNTRVRFFILDI